MDEGPPELGLEPQELKARILATLQTGNVACSPSVFCSGDDQTKWIPGCREAKTTHEQEPNRLVQLKKGPLVILPAFSSRAADSPVSASDKSGRTITKKSPTS